MKSKQFLCRAVDWNTINSEQLLLVSLDPSSSCTKQPAHDVVSCTFRDDSFIK
jgi:hypothetical protein